MQGQNHIRKALNFATPFFSVNRLISWTGRKTILPFYHAVSDVDLPYISNLYPLKTVAQFRQDLDFFCAHYEPVAISEIFSDEKGKPSFHISFDDGLKEVYTLIAPILEEKGIPATFFINTDFVDNKALFYRYKIGLILSHLKSNPGNTKAIEAVLSRNGKWDGAYRSSLMGLNYNDQFIIDELGYELRLSFIQWMKEHQPYLTTDQIKDLQKRGFTIGSHSADHPRFKNISFEAQKDQIQLSLAFLKRNFDTKHSYFSFPFGDDGVGKNLFDWIADESELNLTFGVSGLKDDYLKSHLHRIPMDKCRSHPSRFIKSEYLYFIVKSIFGKNSILRE